MKIIIDCDEDQLELDDELTDNGYIQVSIYSKKEVDGFDARTTTIHPQELVKALQAYL